MSVLFLGCFWIIYGILGLFGIQNIPNKYKNKEWTLKYKRSKGIVWIILGIPYVIFYFIYQKLGMELMVGAIVLLIFSLPALIYALLLEHRYNKLLDE